MSFNNLRMHCYLYCKTVCVFTIWLGQRADMIKQILGSYKLTWGGGGGGVIARNVPPKKKLYWTEN